MTCFTCLICYRTCFKWPFDSFYLFSMLSNLLCFALHKATWKMLQKRLEMVKSKLFYWHKHRTTCVTFLISGFNFTHCRALAASSNGHKSCNFTSSNVFLDFAHAQLFLGHNFPPIGLKNVRNPMNNVGTNLGQAGLEILKFHTIKWTKPTGSRKTTLFRSV